MGVALGLLGGAMILAGAYIQMNRRLVLKLYFYWPWELRRKDRQK